MTKVVGKSTHHFTRVMMALVIGGAFASHAKADSIIGTVYTSAVNNGAIEIDFNFTTVTTWRPIDFPFHDDYNISSTITTQKISASGVAITGTLSASGLTTTNGIDNGGDGITNAGAISGATTINATGTITGGSLLTGGTLGVSGLTSLNGGLTMDSGVFTVADGTGNTAIAGTLNVTGVTALTGNLTANGATNQIGTAGTSANTITGATNAITGTTSTTLVGGSSSATLSNSGMAITGNTSITGTLSSTGNTTLGTNAGTVNTFGSGAGSANTIGNNDSATTVHLNGGNASTSIANNAASMSVAPGGSFSANATTATMRAGGNMGTTTGLATNGTSGTSATLGSGAVTTYNSVQTVGSNTTVNNHLDGKQYQTEVNGNLFVDGNVYINGTLDYVSSNSAATTVFGDTGTSKLSGATQSTSGGTYIVMSGTNGATESMAAMTLTNGIGNTHGIQIYEDRTVLSGGTHSTTMTLDDHGAHFRNDATGGPARVTGVADGHSDFDAVNFRQMSRGVAMAAGLAAIPQVEPGKRFSVGAGTGLYHGQSAMAVGGSGRVGSNTIVKGGVSFSLTKNDDPCANLGVSYSW